METLTLNDGTVLNGHILESGNGFVIFVYLDGMSLAQGYTLFSDSENTSRIVAMSYGNEHIYEGFTELTAINSEYGNCNIMMQRGEEIVEH